MKTRYALFWSSCFDSNFSISYFGLALCLVRPVFSKLLSISFYLCNVLFHVWRKFCRVNYLNRFAKFYLKSSANIITLVTLKITFATPQSSKSTFGGLFYAVSQQGILNKFEYLYERNTINRKNIFFFLTVNIFRQPWTCYRHG